MRLFDELSHLSEENMRSIPYDEYFDEMDLTDKEKEKRKRFSKEFEDVMLFIFSLFSVMRQYGRINKQYSSVSYNQDIQNWYCSTRILTNILMII